MTTDSLTLELLAVNFKGLWVAAVLLSSSSCQSPALQSSTFHQAALRLSMAGKSVASDHWAPVRQSVLFLLGLVQTPPPWRAPDNLPGTMARPTCPSWR